MLQAVRVTPSLCPRRSASCVTSVTHRLTDNYLHETQQVCCPAAGAILSLSLAGPAVMQFRRDGQRRAVYLPRRSLLVLSGEARYAWCVLLRLWGAAGSVRARDKTQHSCKRCDCWCGKACTWPGDLC